MASEDYLMMVSGLLNVAISFLILFVAPTLNMTPEQVVAFIATANGAGGFLTFGKHAIDKRKDSRNGDLEKRVENLEAAVARLLRESDNL